MLCKKPFMRGVIPFGCGQCMPCRINKRRLWTHRLILESQLHQKCCFVTLTYSEENLPKNGSVSPKVVQRWIKRLRRRFPIRYFAVGEYGDRYGRPHYHAILYGVGMEDKEALEQTWSRRKKGWSKHAANCAPWWESHDPIGHILVGTVTPHSAQYVGGYVTKKLKTDDSLDAHDYLQGRHGEFSRMSKNPGLAADAMQQVADAIKNPVVFKLVNQSGDVPSYLEYGKKKWPLGRYLRRCLREKMGWPKDPPETSLKEYSEEMCRLFSESFKDVKLSRLPLAGIVIEKGIQGRRNLEKRAKIYETERTL